MRNEMASKGTILVVYFLLRSRSEAVFSSFASSFMRSHWHMQSSSSGHTFPTVRTSPAVINLINISGVPQRQRGKFAEMGAGIVGAANCDSSPLAGPLDL